MKISVCIPLFNGEDCIDGALESLRFQTTRKPDEVIIQDDCSTDRGPELVKEYNDLPIHFAANDKNLGMICNWNRCLEKASGDIITFLHQDDGYYPEFLAELEKDFNQFPEIGFWVCRGAMYGNWGPFVQLKYKGLLSSKEMMNPIYTLNYVPPPTTVAFRKKALDDAGIYDPKYRYAAEADLYFRILLNNYSVYQSDLLLVWRTVSDIRATAIYGGSNLCFEEMFYFLEKFRACFKDQGKQVLNEAFQHYYESAAKNIAGHMTRLNVHESWQIYSTLQKKVWPLAQEKKIFRISLLVFWKKVMLNSVEIGVKFARRVAVYVVRRLKLIPAKFNRKAKSTFEPYVRTGRRFERDLQKALQSTEPDHEAMRRFLEENSVFDLLSFYLCGPHYRLPWAGKLLTKLPMDIPIYSDLIARAKPNLIIEIGTQRGNSALMLADIAKDVAAKVITLDILRPNKPQLSIFNKKGISFIQADATVRSTYDLVIKASGMSEENINALVIDDGSHLKDHVLESFKLFSSLVQQNGFYIVEDGFSNWMTQTKSHDALGGVEHILKSFKQFTRYNKYDEFMLSSAYLGILQRVS